MKKFAPMTSTFSSTDRMLVFSSLLFSAFFFVQWFNYQPNFLTRNLKNIAIVEKSKEDVRWKIAGNFDWMRPKNGVGLIQGDQIFTGDSSSATIKYLNKEIRINLKPNTLITIEEFGDKLTLELEKGALDIELSENEEVFIKSSKGMEVIKGSEKPVKVQVLDGNTNIIANQNSSLPEILFPDFNHIYKMGELQPVELSKNFDGTIEVSKNVNFFDKVQVFSPKGQMKIESLDLDEAGEYFLRLKQGKNFSSIIPFKVLGLGDIEMNYPSYADENILLDRGVDLTFKWKVIKDFQDEIVIKNSGVEVLSSKNNSGEFVYKMPNSGTYTWQIKRSKKGKVYSESQIIPFKVSYNAPQLSESLKEIYNGESERVVVKLPTLKNEVYDIKVLKMTLDESGNVINSEQVVQKNMDKEILKLDKLPAGKYALEISSRNYSFANPLKYEFKINYLPLKVLGISSLNGNKLNKVKELEVLDAEGSYFVQLADTKLALDKMSFHLSVNDIEIDKMVIVNGKQLQVTLTDWGKHCVTAKVKSPVDQQFYSDVTECFNFKKKNPFPTVTRAKDQVLDFDGKTGEERYILYTPEYNNAVEYRFFVYKDAKAKDLIFKGKSANNKFAWVSNRSGIYFFRYQLVDRKGRESEMSPISRLVFPISPLSEW